MQCHNSIILLHDVVVPHCIFFFIEIALTNSVVEHFVYYYILDILCTKQADRAFWGGSKLGFLKQIGLWFTREIIAIIILGRNP